MPMSDNGAGPLAWLRFSLWTREATPGIELMVGVNVGKSLWSAGVIVAVLLFSGTHRAFAQKQKDTPPPPAGKESADSERAAEGLKKAKPMPDPSHPVTPKTVTPSGGLQGFDSKTGNVNPVPATTKAAAPAKKHKKGKPGAQPKNANGARNPKAEINN